MTQIFERQRNILNILNALILSLGISTRIYGFENWSDNLRPIITQTIGALFTVPLYMYCNSKLLEIRSKQDNEITKIRQEIKIIKEQQEIFESLEEGILLMNKNELQFANSTFQ